MLSKINNIINKILHKEPEDQMSNSSLVRRITMSTMTRRLLLILQLNLLFLILGSIWILVIAEHNIEEAWRDWLATGTPKSGLCLIEANLSQEELQNMSSTLIDNPPVPKSSRTVRWGPPRSQLYGMTYDAWIPLNGSGSNFIHIACYLGPHLVSALRALPLILIIEFLIWLAGAFPSVRSARRLLEPLEEMTLDARLLQKQLPPPGEARNFSRKDLELLAGDIRQTGTRQDARLRVNDPELKGLAEAINAMLRRVHESYWQQSRFVSDASHELRTPIAVIEGYASILSRWGKNDEKVLLESIEAIRSESTHMKDLLEQLLFLARGDNDSMTIQWQMLDIVSLTEEIFRGARIVGEDHEWCFAVEPSHEAVCLRGDEGLLKQTLRILTDNATRYSPAGGEISIRILTQPESIRISVRDHGIGIPTADIPRIFDRFFRSEASHSRRIKGSGLGLSIAKWIVEKHRGSLEVVSQEGVGTCITVELPRNWDGGYTDH